MAGRPLLILAPFAVSLLLAPPAWPARAAVTTSITADPEKGKVLFDQCAACHALDDTSADGPTLKGVFGRRAGSLESFRYSAAMRRSNVVWDATTIDAFITDPQAYMKGNRMAFAGMTDPSERDDLIAFLDLAAKAPEDRRLP